MGRSRGGGPPPCQGNRMQHDINEGRAMKKCVTGMDVAGKVVLVRADLDVPVRNGRVLDDAPLQEAADGLRPLVDAGAKVLVAAHAGAPQGEVVEAWRLDPIAQRLSDILEREVLKADDCVGGEILDAVDDMALGELLLLENTLFHPEEAANDAAFAAALAAPAALFVNDAFALAHCAWASTVGVAAHREAVAGPLLARDLARLAAFRDADGSPPLVIVGGLCDPQTLHAIDHFAGLGSTVLLGGVVANTFLKAAGIAVHASVADAAGCEEAARVLRAHGDRLVLPVDALVADKIGRDAQRKMFALDAIPEGWAIVDIGPETIDRYLEYIDEARRVVWSGPMGVAEAAAYSEGSCTLSHRIAESGAPAAIGGGATLAAVRRSGDAEDLAEGLFRGGCAMLKYLEGASLPAIEALRNT